MAILKCFPWASIIIKIKWALDMSSLFLCGPCVFTSKVFPGIP